MSAGGVPVTTEPGAARSAAPGGPRRARSAAGRAGSIASGAAPAAIAGGVLWIPYGVFEMLAPLGVDAVYDAGRGYEVVADRLLHVTYSLPGAMALVLSAIALLGIVAGRPRTRAARTAGIGGWLALGAGGLAVAGATVGFDPLFTGPRVLGTLALGAATLIAARAMVRSDVRRHLAVLGVAGIALMPLWPLIYAVELVPAGVGAAFIAGFGIGWVALGARLLAR